MVNWQIPLHPDSTKLTTFITPMGRFCFRRLPFGITSAPEIFQHTMTSLLKDQEGTAAIQDDIIVYGRSVAEHDKRLQEVFNIIAKSGLKLNKTLEVLSASKESAQIQIKYKQFRNFRYHRMYHNCDKYWA